MKQVKLNKKREVSPHVTPALKSSLKERNRLERLAKKWPLTYKEYYRKYRNTLTSTLRTATNKYYQDKLKCNQGNPKFHWKCINNILGRTTNNGNNKWMLQISLMITFKMSQIYHSKITAIVIDDIYQFS